MKNKFLILLLSLLAVGLGEFIALDRLFLSKDKCNADLVENEFENNEIENNEFAKDNLIDAEYDVAAFVNDNVVYYICANNDGYFVDSKIEQLDSLDFNVSKIRLIAIGLDPSVTLHLISTDGKVYIADLNTGVVSLVTSLSDYKVVDIKDVATKVVQDELKHEYTLILDGNKEEKVFVD